MYGISDELVAFDHWLEYFGFNQKSNMTELETNAYAWGNISTVLRPEARLEINILKCQNILAFLLKLHFIINNQLIFHVLELPANCICWAGMCRPMSCHIFPVSCGAYQN